MYRSACSLLLTCGAFSIAAKACDGSLIYTVDSQYMASISINSPCIFSPGSGASSASVFSSFIPAPDSCEGFTFSSDSDVGVFAGYGSATAVASLGSAGTRPYASATATLSPTSLDVSLGSGIQYGLVCSECTVGLRSQGAAASTSVFTEVDCQWEMTVTVDTFGVCPDDGTDMPAQPAGVVWVSYTGLDSLPKTEAFGPLCGSEVPCGNSTGSATTIAGAAGPIQIGSVPTATFPWLDFNQDGRVNELDGDAILLLIPIVIVSSPDPLEAFDFDSNGLIDSSDVAVYNALLSAGLGQGVLGDIDSDFVTNCGDLAGILAFPFGTSSACSGNGYLVALDADLDGDNDMFDRGVILRLIQPADLTEDGVLNFADVNLFATSFSVGDPIADVNGDGLVNFSDVSAFTDSFNNPCP